MKQKELVINYLEYENISQLPDDEQILINKAIEATGTAYAPYSQFKVGTAIELSSGKIVVGSNQENSVYPLCLCAERVAIFTAKSSHPDETIEKIAITAFSENFNIEKPVFPCGSCRQVMIETLDRQNGKCFKIILHAPNSKIIVFNSINDLLPMSFDGDWLQTKK
jgi:cytidine deaminase